MNDQKDNCSDYKKTNKSMMSKRKSIIKMLDVATFLIPVIIVASFSGIFPKFLDILTHRTPQKTTHEKLFEYLGNGFSNDRFSEQFVKTAFNHFDRKVDGALTKYGYIETLEDFIVYLNSHTDSKNKFDTTKIDEVNKLLTEAKNTEPFASLPSEEKRLMDHIQILLKNGVPEAELNNSMKELKQVILARHKEYQKIESQNSWSIPLAFAGVFFTIMFGVWSIILSIRKKRNELQRTYFEPTIITKSTIGKTAEQSAGEGPG